jgi:hypothetical protein
MLHFRSDIEYCFEFAVPGESTEGILVHDGS